MLAGAKRELALRLFEIGAVKFGAFRLKLHEREPDAPLSPIYIDLRLIRSFPSVMAATVNVYKELIQGLNFDLLADVPTAATPIAAILSYDLGVGMISPKKEEKGHGITVKVDGFFKEGNVVLLVDDLVTQADSKLEAIRGLEHQGLIVRDVVVLIDREQGGPQQLERSGYRCHAAFPLSEILGLYMKEGKISKDDYERTTAYLKSVS
jgi:orotate phosphoribosyltransferase